MSETATAERERKFKRAKLRRVKLVPFNAFDSYQRIAIMAECAYQAASEMFPWLSVDQTRTPPRTMLDAKLARQVAIYAMATVMNIPQRQIARLQGRQRTSIHFAIRTVETRLAEPCFAEAFETMAERVRGMMEDPLDRAA